jgi:hypothetical protein
MAGLARLAIRRISFVASRVARRAAGVALLRLIPIRLAILGSALAGVAIRSVARLAFPPLVLTRFARTRLRIPRTGCGRLHRSISGPPVLGLVVAGWRGLAIATLAVAGLAIEFRLFSHPIACGSRAGSRAALVTRLTSSPAGLLVGAGLIGHIARTGAVASWRALRGFGTHAAFAGIRLLGALAVWPSGTERLLIGTALLIVPARGRTICFRTVARTGLLFGPGLPGRARLRHR